MDAAFWKERWQTRQIGFHQGRPHHYLERFGGRLFGAKDPRVLVPLCGKSRDLMWLAHGGALVTGAELVGGAVEEFFQEAGVEPERDIAGQHQLLSDSELGVRIFVGDFFRLAPHAVGPITGVYDRAALVALPPALRERYVEHLLEFLPVGAGLLLVTVVYDEAAMDGPPFSVRRDEVERLFSPCAHIELLASESVIETEVRFLDRGLSDLWEEAHWIIR